MEVSVLLTPALSKGQLYLCFRGKRKSHWQAASFPGTGNEHDPLSLSSLARREASCPTITKAALLKVALTLRGVPTLASSFHAELWQYLLHRTFGRVQKAVSKVTMRVRAIGCSHGTGQDSQVLPVGHSFSTQGHVAPQNQPCSAPGSRRPRFSQHSCISNMGSGFGNVRGVLPCLFNSCVQYHLWSHWRVQAMLSFFFPLVCFIFVQNFIVESFQSSKNSINIANPYMPITKFQVPSSCWPCYLIRALQTVHQLIFNFLKT